MRADIHEHGDQLKQRVLADLESRRAVYVLYGRRALLTALCFKGTATADDVRAAVSLPDDIDAKCLGAVPGPLVAAGIIAPDGFIKSRRPEAHARPVQQWKLADRAAALQWMAEHPNRPGPIPERPNDETTLFDIEKCALDAVTPSAFS